MKPPRRSRKAIVLLYSIGVLAIVIALGRGIQNMGAQVPQMHNRGAFQDQAHWAALSGITYGRRHIQELWRASARPRDAIYGGQGYPGVVSRRPGGGRNWLGACWTGFFTSPRSHEDANPGVAGTQWDQRNSAGFEMRLGLMTFENQGLGALRGLVYTRVRLDETLIRNGFFFGEFENNGFAPAGYDPKLVNYFLEAVGRVDVPDAAVPGDRNLDRVASVQRVTLSFQLPVGPAIPVPAVNPTSFYRERFWVDRVLDFHGR